ncbi:MAG: hypothetical protein AAF213_10340, partial [Pseudomonadota bacterium]
NSTGGDGQDNGHGDGHGQDIPDVSRWRQGKGDVVPNMGAIIAAAEAERDNSSQRTSKFAAVVFDRRTGDILSVASNQLASGLEMTKQEMAQDRDLKDKSIGHAEERALDQYAKSVLKGEAKAVPPEHLGVYATNFCCPRCARKISEQGVGLFVSTTNSLDPDDPSPMFGRFAKNWSSDTMLGKRILESRKAEDSGAVETALVTIDSSLKQAAKGRFKWADNTVDHFKKVRAQAELQALGKGGYIPPARKTMAPVANDDRGVNPGKRPGNSR